MIYPIVVYGDPVLKEIAKDIEKDTVEIMQISEDMFETMKNASGIGLAAPQIGLSICMFVVDGSGTEEDDLMDFKKIFINPQIVKVSDEDWVYEEGCLSIPQIRDDVTRPFKIKIKYLDENWDEHEEVHEGLIARIIQHEYDHIQGVLFIDHLTSFKRRILKGKLADITKGDVNTAYPILAPLKKKAV